MRTGMWTSALVYVVVLTACGGTTSHRDSHTSSRATADTQQATPPPAATNADRADTLVCAQDVGTSRRPDPSLQVVLGVAGLPTAARAAALQTARTGERDRRIRLFAKTGLLVRAGAAFQLVVPPELTNRLSIAWGNAHPPHGRLVVSGCGRHGRAGARWLAYAGGYFVPRPECVSLLVVTAHRRQRVRIGLGTPCPGQRPVQGPTQS